MRYLQQLDQLALSTSFTAILAFVFVARMQKLSNMIFLSFEMYKRSAKSEAPVDSFLSVF